MASQFGQVGVGLSGDVNDDGQVNIFDLVIIGSSFGQTAAAAPALAAASALPDGDIKQVRQALAALEGMDNPSHGTLIAIDFLHAWLDVVDPSVTETKLHPNYPNPFNPEMWIPYQLADDADVMVEIYNVRGELVRTLALGFKAKGYYMARDKAAYWDGRSDNGERTASGVYFYHLRAGEYAATRKMIIAK